MLSFLSLKIQKPRNTETVIVLVFVQNVTGMFFKLACHITRKSALMSRYTSVTTRRVVTTPALTSGWSRGM